tara:strand:- start:127 stop:657 length:531 start_codon:yes stop_codon:yes gene_type:complete
MRKILTFLVIAFVIVACEKEDDQPNNPTVNGGGNNTDPTTEFNNSYQFSDDMKMCFPLFEPSLPANAILSIISQPCSKSGSKFDGYFKFNSSPKPGTYKVVGTAGVFPVASQLGTDQFTIVFYGHGESTLYSVGGTVELTKNILDTNELDLNWKNVDMAYEHDGSIIQFSGNLNGL